MSAIFPILPWVPLLTGPEVGTVRRTGGAEPTNYWVALSEEGRGTTTLTSGSTVSVVVCEVLVEIPPLERDLIRGSALTPDARSVARKLQSLVRQNAPSLAEEVTSLDDGSLALEYEDASGTKSLMLVLPPDGSVRYFIARGPGLRHAGIVREDLAVEGMARWAVGRGAFPSSGLEIGKSPALDR